MAPVFFFSFFLIMAPVRLLTEIPEDGTATKSWHFKTNTKAHVKTDRRHVNHSFPILHT